MANTLTGTFVLTRKNASNKQTPGNIPSKSISVSSASDLYYQNVQVVGTSAEAIATGDVTDTAMMVIENLDTSASDGATVSVGYDNAGFVARFTVPVGEIAVIPRVSTIANWQLKSDFASTNVLISLWKIA